MISNRIFYLLALITVGWAITYFLRALPFILFSLKIKKLPPWIDKVGIIISPIINLLYDGLMGGVLAIFRLF